MSGSMPGGSDPDRLARVLDDYLEAVARGKRPSRQEVVSRHPDLAADLESGDW